MRDADDGSGLFPDRGGEHRRPVAHGRGGKPFRMVEEEDVVNGQQEALPTQQQRAVITEVDEVGAAGRDWEVELLVEEAAQTRRQGRRRIPLEPTLLGFL